MSKNTGSTPVHVKNTQYSAIETDKTLQPKSDKTVNKMTSFDKEKVDKQTPATKTNTKPSKSLKRKSAHKYTPILSPPPQKKISPLLSTIGLSLISTDPTINSSDQLPVICDNTLIDVSSVSVNTSDCPNIPTSELPLKYNPATPADNIEEMQAQQQSGLHVRMSSCDNLRQEKDRALLADAAANSHSICLDMSHRSENTKRCYNVLISPQLNHESQIQKYLPATENLQDKTAPISKSNIYPVTNIQQEHDQILMSQAAHSSLQIHSKDKENLINARPGMCLGLSCSSIEMINM